MKSYFLFIFFIGSFYGISEVFVVHAFDHSETFGDGQWDWIASGPFEIDSKHYSLGQKIFMRIGELGDEEKGQISVMRPLNSTHYSVYHTIPFDGSKKNSFNYYFDVQLSKTKGLCSVDDVIGKWALVFQGTDYPNLNFEITDSVLPGTNWKPVCEIEDESPNPDIQRSLFSEERWDLYAIVGKFYLPDNTEAYQAQGIPYQIKNATISSIVRDGITNLIVKIKPESDGILDIKLPRNVIDARIGIDDDAFFVLIDGEERDFFEEKLINPESICFRYFVIPFEKETSEIEFIISYAGMPGFTLIEDYSHSCLLNPSPKLQTKSGILPEKVVCKVEFELIFKSNTGSPACVKPSTVEKLVERGWATIDSQIKEKNLSVYPLTVSKKGNFEILYALHGSNLVQIKSDPDANSLIINLENSSDGKITIHVPRDLVDATIGAEDDAFFVLVNGEEVEFEEISQKSKRILEIKFPKGAIEIEIIGTNWI